MLALAKEFFFSELDLPAGRQGRKKKLCSEKQAF